MATNTQTIQSLNKSEIREALIEGTRLAFARLIERKRKENGYIVISQNGKVVKIKAADFNIPSR